MKSELLEPMYLAIEEDLKQSIRGIRPPLHTPVEQMLSHHFGWNERTKRREGGKRLRPLYTLLCCAAAGGPWQEALPAASCVELIHNFSLIHDDIQDASTTRRNRLTVWKKWGIAQAINTGDALFVLAHLANYRLIEAGLAVEVVLDVQNRIDKACLQLTMGQYLDLAFEQDTAVSSQDYMVMVAGKTASLLGAGTASGARIAGAPAEIVREYHQFGRQVGLAFQILDDILGIWGSEQMTGKPTGDDLRKGKKSLPIILGLARSSAFQETWQGGASQGAEIETLTDQLETAGVLEECRSLAVSHTDLALEHLENAQPVPPYYSLLVDLTKELLERNR